MAVFFTYLFHAHIRTLPNLSAVI
jgi:hypothetical protein